MFSINANRYEAHLNRSLKLFEDHSFLFHQIEEDMSANLSIMKTTFQNRLIISPHRPIMLDYDTWVSPDCLSSNIMYDLVISIFQIQWEEDPLKTMQKIKSILGEGGLFMGIIPGGDSLIELRTSLMQAELELTGGAHQRTTPMIRPEDLVNLTVASGFKEPVVNVEKLTITYPDLKTIIKDLRGMGQTMKFGNPKFSRNLFKRTEEIYHSQFATANSELPLTLDIITATAWS